MERSSWHLLSESVFRVPVLLPRERFHSSTELKLTGFTTLAVIDPPMHSSEELHAILGLFDGEINISDKETEKGPEKHLKVKKMSNQKYLENELHLTKGELQKQK